MSCPETDVERWCRRRAQRRAAAAARIMRVVEAHDTGTVLPPLRVTYGYGDGRLPALADAILTATASAARPASRADPNAATLAAVHRSLAMTFGPEVKP